MARPRSNPTLKVVPDQHLVDEVADLFVHPAFARVCISRYVACPDDERARAVYGAVEQRARSAGVVTELVDLRPAPAERLNAVTERICERRWVRDGMPPTYERVFVLDGFDLFNEDDKATYPFRTEMQWDEHHGWLFMGRNLPALRNLFNNYRLALYGAATNITPEEWRAVCQGKAHSG